MNEFDQGRFWSRVALPDVDGCVLWTAGVGGSGYGSFNLNGRTVLAHRAAYELLVGPIPPRMMVDHTCWSRRCVNVAHMRLVTNAQNMQNRRGARRNTRSGKRGVLWDGRRQQWFARVRHEGVQHYGGYFAEMQDAERAAIALRNRLFTHNDADRHALADGENGGED